MPNWNANTLTLTATTPHQVAILNSVEDAYNAESGIFDVLYPIPAHIYRGPIGEAEREKYGENNWYYWCVANWGTKWDATVNDISREDTNTLWLVFDTAWSPPLALYEYLHAAGWQINATYYEPGMGFAGRWCDGSDQFVDNIFDIVRQPEDSWGEHVTELNEQYGIADTVAEMDADEEYQ